MFQLQNSLAGWTVGLAFAATFAACAHKNPEPFIKDDLRQVTATVEAVYLPTRMVSLRGPNGPTTITVAPGVRNLDQVQVGDQLQVSYYEGLAAQIRRRGKPNEGFQDETAIVSSPRGERPAGGVGQSTTTTVKIESVDTSFDTVTFRHPDGLVRTIAVESPEGRKFIRTLSSGDEVDVMYTEAVAVEVLPTE